MSFGVKDSGPKRRLAARSLRFSAAKDDDILLQRYQVGHGDTRSNLTASAIMAASAELVSST
jgi:hypothetical protein